MAFIIDNILLSPIRLTVWVAEKLRDTAYQEVTDDSRVHEELLHLQMRYEMGEISDDAYEAEETRLMAKLEEIRKIKEEQAI
ncbi:MAG: gas vesicle protein GvpG [Deltaproteobacteria bacterium]|nr:gas vesicle protein GvpG [Deltaproteobacteria bacterium]